MGRAVSPAWICKSPEMTGRKWRFVLVAFNNMIISLPNETREL